jgi:hypothetical protein
MAEQQLQYLQAYGNITKALDKIIEAQTPERFTQDYLGTKLGLTGGGSKARDPVPKSACTGRSETRPYLESPSASATSRGAVRYPFRRASAAALVRLVEA